MPTVSYPFDTTGLASSNLVSGEVHQLTEANDDTYNIIIPKFAPFYLDNFVLMHVTEAGVPTTLTADVDYYFALPYIGASRSIGKMVYGGISINTDFDAGTLTLAYQTIGGDWIADPDWVLTRLAQLVYNPKTTVWDIVTNKPNQFPPINHSLDIAQVYGEKELIDAIDSLATGIATDIDKDALLKHELDATNPHRTTAHQTGTYTAAEIDAMIKAIDLTPFAYKDPLPTKVVEDNTGAIVTDCGGATTTTTALSTEWKLYGENRQLGLEEVVHNCYVNSECSLIQCLQCTVAAQCSECSECRQCTECNAQPECSECTECTQCVQCTECDSSLGTRQCSECDWLLTNCLQCDDCTVVLDPLQCNTVTTQCTTSQCTLTQCTECSHAQCSECTQCSQCKQCVQCSVCTECSECS